MTDSGATPAGGKARFAYVGCYTRRAPSDASGLTPIGIAAFAIDGESGALTHLQTVPSHNPSFLAIHPNRRFLYAVCEIDDHEGKPSGAVEAYAIDPATGELTRLNQETTHGAATTHLEVSPDGRFVAVASYSGSTFAVFPLREDGSLAPASDVIRQTGTGPNQERQEKPHPHGVIFDPINGHLITADLGIDKVQVFRLDPAGKAILVSEAATEPGAGPRHLAISADGRVVYCINEMHATIGVHPFDPATGQIRPAIQIVSTGPDDFVGLKSTSEVAVHPSGRFVYGSNRGGADPQSPIADSIAAFAVDTADGTLTPLGHAADGIDEPRHFGIDPTGTWLYACNQHAHTIAQFRIDAETGQLEPTGLVAESPVPVCIVFLAT